jgi:hypothetical protein
MISCTPTIDEQIQQSFFFGALSFKACPCTEDTLSSEIKETFHHWHAREGLSQEKNKFSFIQKAQTYVFIYLCGSSMWFFVGLCSPTGTGTSALDPTFGSFTLIELVSH